MVIVLVIKYIFQRCCKISLFSLGWDGFSTYPYTYAGRTTGSQFQDLTNPTIFHDFIGMPLTLVILKVFFIIFYL